MHPRDQERRTYEDMWSVPPYRDYAPGVEHVEAFLAMSGAQPPATLLDAGCGTGRGGQALATHGFRVTLCDLTPNGLDPAIALPFLEACLWDDLQPVGATVRQPWWRRDRSEDRFDWIYACDVLEHLPPEYTMLAVARLLAVARRGAFFSIGLTPDRFGAYLGKPLHQTVMPFAWWRDHLAAFAGVRMRECRDCLTTGLYCLEAIA